MAKTGRWAAAMMVGVTLWMPRVSGAADAPARHHVRSEDPALGTLILRGIEQSPTFNALVATVDASDSFVYVKTGRCRHAEPACFVSVTPAGSGRVLWVKVDTTRDTTDEDVIASLGHELRHTTEVIAEPSIRCNADQFFFYERIGAVSASGSHETDAAVNAGLTVRAEVRQFVRHMERGRNR